MSQPILPLFHSAARTPSTPVQIQPATPKPRKPHQQRWDKTHGMKFPINEEQERQLRILYKRHLYQAKSITVFVTMMLRYGLRNPSVIREQDYKDTGIYKTAKPNQIEYSLIGGERGYAIEWGLSERKALHRIVISVLSYMEAGGRIDHESIQPLKPSQQKG